MATNRKSTEQSYLDRLQFDPQLLGSFVAKYLGSIRIILLLILAISLGGLISFSQLPKRLNPEVEIPIVIVVTALPGASPEDVESLVTIPLEDELLGAEGLDVLTSVSNQNVSVVTMQFLSQVDRDEAKNDVQSIVDGVTDLPEDAQAPRVTALDFEDFPIWTFSITTEADQSSLMAFSRELERRIEALPKVDRVELSGFETQEVVISLKPEKVREFGINPLLLSQAIQRGVASYPAGSVATKNNSFAVTINPSVTSIDDLRQLQVSVQGHALLLGDIATIEERAKRNQTLSYLVRPSAEPQRAVTFSVFKALSSSIDQAGAEVEAEVESVLEEYDHKFALTTTSNTSEDIQEQFTDLLGEFRTTILLVSGTLLIFLGLRQAIISTFTVPLTFLSAFVFMQMLGMSINFLSLFAFLLALGLLVDDTIVVVSAMTSYYRTGKFTPLQTGLLVWRDTIVPIWSTTLTTIWAFVPLLITGGIIGEFIKPIPIVVTVTMLSSTAIAVLITLPIMIVILKPNIPYRVALLFKMLGLLAVLGILAVIAWANPLWPLIALAYFAFIGVILTTLPVWRQWATRAAQHRWVKPVISRFNHIKGHGIVNLEGFGQWYYRKILAILNSDAARRTVMAAITIYAVVCFALLPLGLVKNEFFPKSDLDTIQVTVELPVGTTLEQTKIEAERLLTELQQTPEAKEVVMVIGQTGQGLSESLNRVTYTIHLLPNDERDISSIDIAQGIRDQYQNYAQGKLSVVEETGGPPAGADLQIQLLGNDLTQLDGYANQVVGYLESQPGVANVEKSITTGTPQLVFVPDLTKVANAGLSVDQLGLWLRMYASGFTLDSIEFEGQDQIETDVVFKLETDNPDPSGIFALSIPNQMGQSVPLESLGRIETRPNPTQITREDGERSITITGTTLPGFNTAQQNQGLEAFADTMDLANGYSWKTGGVNEENQESVNSILQAMVVSAVLIMITMVLQFGSFRQAFIILIVIPIAVSSVFLIFALTGTPLSFPALIGVLALFGIVVTNSMFIVDKINLNRREGMELKEAIADAGASRMEPIILTKLSTVLGLLPITIADPLWRGLGGAIISGILLSSTIMLLFIPALYYTIFRSTEKDANVSRRAATH